MGNRRRTYDDLCVWLDAESLAFDEERAGRVLGRRGKDGETVYEKKARSLRLDTEIEIKQIDLVESRLRARSPEYRLIHAARLGAQ